MHAEFIFVSAHENTEFTLSIKPLSYEGVHQKTLIRAFFFFSQGEGLSLPRQFIPTQGITHPAGT